MVKVPKKAPRVYGLKAKDYPKNIKDRFDFDYLDKLSPEDRAWLARFAERHYGASFTNDPDGEWSTEQRRSAYRAKNAVNQDLYSVSSTVGLIEFPELPINPPADSDQQKDWAPRVNYEQHPVYRKLLVELREAIDGQLVLPKAERRKNEPRILALRARLERLAKKLGA